MENNLHAQLSVRKPRKKCGSAGKPTCPIKQTPSQLEWVERLNIQYPTRNIQPMKGRKDELSQQLEKINSALEETEELSPILFKSIDATQKGNAIISLDIGHSVLDIGCSIISIFCVFTHSK